MWTAETHSHLWLSSVFKVFCWPVVFRFRYGLEGQRAQRTCFYVRLLPDLFHTGLLRKTKHLLTLTGQSQLALAHCHQNSHHLLHWWRVFLLRPYQGRIIAFTPQKRCCQIRLRPPRQEFEWSDHNVSLWSFTIVFSLWSNKCTAKLTSYCGIQLILDRNVIQNVRPSNHQDSNWSNLGVPW